MRIRTAVISPPISATNINFGGFNDPQRQESRTERGWRTLFILGSFAANIGEKCSRSLQAAEAQLESCGYNDHTKSPMTRTGKIARLRQAFGLAPWPAADGHQGDAVTNGDARVSAQNQAQSK